MDRPFIGPRTSRGRRWGVSRKGGIPLPTDCNLAARGDRSLADDLDERVGRVRGGDGVFRRPAERKPIAPDLSSPSQWDQ